MSRAHALMQELVYPAFLGTFLVNLVFAVLGQSIGYGGFIKASLLLILFGILYSDIALCPANNYNAYALFLDIAAIMTMTINFGFVGMFRFGIVESYKELLAKPLFEWSGFFFLNTILIHLSERYRSDVLFCGLFVIHCYLVYQTGNGVSLDKAFSQFSCIPIWPSSIGNIGLAGNSRAFCCRRPAQAIS